MLRPTAVAALFVAVVPFATGCSSSASSDDAGTPESVLQGTYIGQTADGADDPTNQAYFDGTSRYVVVAPCADDATTACDDVGTYAVADDLSSVTMTSDAGGSKTVPVSIPVPSTATTLQPESAGVTLRDLTGPSQTLLAASPSSTPLYAPGGAFFKNPTTLYTAGGTLYHSLTDDEEIAYKFFVGHGFSHVQAAAVAGNLDAVSGVSPTLVTGKAHGIAQWLEGNRWDTNGGNNVVDFAKGKTLPATSLTLQLEFVLYELEMYPSYGLPQMKQATTLAAATTAFEKNFEACGAACGEATRIADAKAIYDRYNPPATAGGTGTNASYDAKAAVAYADANTGASECATMVSGALRAGGLTSVPQTDGVAPVFTALGTTYPTDTEIGVGQSVTAVPGDVVIFSDDVGDDFCDLGDTGGEDENCAHICMVAVGGSSGATITLDCANNAHRRDITIDDFITSTTLAISSSHMSTYRVYHLNGAQ